MPDIDIDFADRTLALKLFNHTVASRDDHGEVKAHNTGIYVTDIPKDVRTNLSTIDYKTAEDRGYFKIDFLNVSVYNQIKNEEHLKFLMEAEPLWDLLLQEDFVNLLFHLNGHGEVLKKTCPTSVEQLGAVLAMIRPAKRHLIGKTWTEIMAEVWTKPTTDEYYFKKAHAIAYAMAIIVQMNLICESLSEGGS
jgi:hypothetical protein